MATIYFTNNADSGDGSLREAISLATAGDTISPSPSLSANNNEIQINLSSSIIVSKQLTFDAGNNVVILNAQSSCRVLQSYNVETVQPVTFNRFRFHNGTTSSGGGIYYQGYDKDSYLFNNCVFSCGSAVNYGGAVYILKGAVIFNNCVVTCSKCSITSNGGGVRVANTSLAAVFNDCTFAGNAVTDISVQSDANATFNNCLIVYSSSVINCETLNSNSVASFVCPPAETVSNDDLTPTSYDDIDLRLLYNSNYLECGEAVNSVDITGEQRKERGAVGAYEGGYFCGGDIQEDYIETDYLAYSSALDLQNNGANAHEGYVLINNTIKDAIIMISNRLQNVLAIHVSGMTLYVTIKNAPEILSINSNFRWTSLGINIKTFSVDVKEDKVIAMVNGEACPDETLFEYSFDKNEWTMCKNGEKLNDSRSLYFRMFDGSFHVSERIPRTYYYSGGDVGSFTNADDWKLDVNRTIALAYPPTIEDCTFYAIKKAEET